MESLFYAVLEFSPILCAGLLFGSAIKRSTSVARDYGTNLLGAMVGGTAEYASLVTGFRVLLFIIAACYIGAVIARATVSAAARSQRGCGQDRRNPPALHASTSSCEATLDRPPGQRPVREARPTEPKNVHDVQ